MSKETFYFSHDYNTRNDPKIKKLIARHKWAGYGLFWAIIEDLYNNSNSMPTDYETIAYGFRVKKEIVQSVIEDFELFILENNFFGSLSVQKRFDERNNKSLKASKSASYRWEKNANAKQSQSDSNAIKESKVKEKKIKESKDIEDVVLYLNRVLKSSFKPDSNSSIKFISARLNENFNLDDFKAVIDFQFKEWGSDEKMAKFLRPETLFGNKFEGYLEASKKIIINNNGTAKQNTAINAKASRDSLGDVARKILASDNGFDNP